MAIPQAEKITSKIYPGNPRVSRSAYVFNYKEVRVKSQPFVQYLEYTKKTPRMTDQLLLGFNSPVGDDRIVAMVRVIQFDPHAANEPLVSSIQASLVKKYGTPAAKNDYMEAQLWWALSQKGRVPCPSGECFNALPYNSSYFGDSRFMAVTSIVGEYRLNFKPAPSDGFNYEMIQRCGAILDSNKPVADDVVRIWAEITPSSADSSKASSTEIYVYYIKPCIDDLIDARSQMKAAAIKRYQAISKTPAAPSF